MIFTNQILIVYFSLSGNTKNLAIKIRNIIGGELVRLESEKEYPRTYNQLEAIAKREQQNKVRPKLKTNITNINAYQTIFIGYPIWLYSYPMIILSFLDNYDFKEKTIIPFVTHEGSGMLGTDRELENYLPNSKVLKGLDVMSINIDDCDDEIKKWLKEIDFKK